MSETINSSRRNFIRNLAMGAGGMVFIGNFGVAYRVMGTETNPLIRGIIVDFTRCTGCRTCETVCSAFNHPVTIEGDTLNGLGNPWLSNIKVQWFNPDVDIPMVCSHCDDAPCIAACPVEEDEYTGYKAMYHSPETHSVVNDPDRCIGCGFCARACKNNRTGVINRYKDGKPFGMCNLCGGQPKCVDYCTYHALKFTELTSETPYRGLSPQKIAVSLIRQFYDMDVTFQ